MIPPDPTQFPIPNSLQAGIAYVWATLTDVAEFQDAGYELTNQRCENNGARYHLLHKGSPDRTLSADNVVPDIRAVFPDEWLENTPKARLEEAATEEGGAESSSFSFDEPVDCEAGSATVEGTIESSV